MQTLDFGCPEVAYSVDRLHKHTIPVSDRVRTEMATTTKKDLIERVAQETNLPRADVRRAVQSFLEHVIDELSKGNRLEFRDFGVFEIRERAGRVAQNPKTLERVSVPPRKSVRFKVGRLMQQSLDGNGVEVREGAGAMAED